MGKLTPMVSNVGVGNAVGNKQEFLPELQSNNKNVNNGLTTIKKGYVSRPNTGGKQENTSMNLPGNVGLWNTKKRCLLFQENAECNFEVSLIF